MKIEPEWIEWTGGECPIHHSKHVVVTKRNGDVRNGYGDTFDWGCDGYDPYEVIAYCPLDIEPYKPQPKWTVDLSDVDPARLCFEGQTALFFPNSYTAINNACRIADALNAAGVDL